MANHYDVAPSIHRSMGFSRVFPQHLPMLSPSIFLDTTRSWRLHHRAESRLHGYWRDLTRGRRRPSSPSHRHYLAIETVKKKETPYYRSFRHWQFVGVILTIWLPLLTVVAIEYAFSVSSGLWNSTIIWQLIILVSQKFRIQRSKLIQNVASGSKEALWTLLELDLAIVCTSLIFMRPFFQDCAHFGQRYCCYFHGAFSKHVGYFFKHPLRCWRPRPESREDLLPVTSVRWLSLFGNQYAHPSFPVK